MAIIASERKRCDQSFYISTASHVKQMAAYLTPKA